MKNSLFFCGCIVQYSIGFRGEQRQIVAHLFSEGFVPVMKTHFWLKVALWRSLQGHSAAVGRNCLPEITCVSVYVKEGDMRAPPPAVR